MKLLEFRTTLWLFEDELIIQMGEKAASFLEDARDPDNGIGDDAAGQAQIVLDACVEQMNRRRGKVILTDDGKFDFISAPKKDGLE